jgi:hypothetical protein
MKAFLNTNKYVIFFRLLFALESNAVVLHPFARKIVGEFQHVRKLPMYKDFIEHREDDTLYSYLFYSVHLGENLQTLSLAPHDGFGPNRFKYFQEKIAPLVSPLWIASHFDEIYSKTIEPEYKKIVTKFQEELDNLHFVEVLSSFWKSDSYTKFIIIPDLFGVFEGFATSRGNTAFSITGAELVNNESQFTKEYFVWNSLHEFSHILFKEALYDDDDLYEKNNSLCVEIENKYIEMIKNAGYAKVSTYLEETYIRALQIILSERVCSTNSGLNKPYRSTKSMLQKLEKDGYVFIKEFYVKLLENEGLPLNAYFKAIEEIV